MADLTLTATSITNVSCRVEEGTLGAAVTAGQIVYRDPADLKAKLSDTNGADANIRSVWGMALNGGASGQAVRIAVGEGEVAMGPVLTAGAVYVLSATPGGIAPVADLATGHYTAVLGIARSATNLYLAPIQGLVARP